MVAIGCVVTLLLASGAAAKVLVQGTQPPGTFGLRFGPDGKLYVPSIAAGIVILDPETGQMLGFLGPEQGVLSPEDLAFGSDGSLYWNEMFVGNVGRRAPDGTVTHQMVAPGVNPLAFGKGGRLFVSVCWFADVLLELDPNLVNPPRQVASGLGWLKGIDFGADGKLYGASVLTGRIVKIDVDATPPTVETVASGFAAPFTAKFDSQGRLVVNDRGASKLYHVDPATGTKQLIAEVPFGVDNVAIGPSDRLFVSSYSDGGVYEVNADGTLRTVIPGGMLLPTTPAVVGRADGESVFIGNILAMREYDGATGTLRNTVREIFTAPPAFGGAWTVSSDGGNLVVTSLFPYPSVQVLDPLAGTVIENYNDFNMPVNAIRFKGDLVVVELGTAAGEAKVTRAGPAGRTTMADASMNILVPVGLAATTDSLWVSDWATGLVWQLVAGGAQLTPPRPVASGLRGPEGLAVDRDGSLLVVEAGAAQVSRINPTTGEVSTVVGGLALGAQGFGVLPPFGFVNGVAVGPSGAVYVGGDLANVLYKLTPRTIYVPAAAHTAGLLGSVWRTDIDINNRGTTQSSYTVELLESGKANATPKSSSFALDPGMSALYPDVVQSLFQFNGTGALRIRAADGDLLVSSVTSNAAGGGHFGAYAAGLDDALATGENQEVRLIHLSNSATSRTNVGVVNASGAPITVDIALVRADGVPVGQRSLVLLPYSHLQQNDIFNHLTTVSVTALALANIEDAYAVVHSSTPGARFFAYASVVDNATGSPVHIPAR